MAKKNSKKTVPDLRFRGFTDPWEQRQLEELVSDGIIALKRGNVIPRQTGRYPVYSSSTAKDGLFCTSDSFMFDQELVTWSIDGGGKPFYRPRHRFSVTNVCGYALIHNPQTFTYRFLGLAMDRAWTRAHFDYSSKAHPSVIEKMYVLPIPSLPEQHRIGEFFSTLDSLIAAAERQETLLRQKKQAYLQLMFPCEGETQPRLRFSGFTEEWQELRLGKLYMKNTERNGNQFDAEKTLSVSSMTFNPLGNGAAEESLASYKILRIADAAFEGHTSNEFAFGRFVVNTVGAGIMSPRFASIRPTDFWWQSCDLDFWACYLHDEGVMKRILVRSTKRGTMMNELVFDDFFAGKMRVPSLPEQRLIGQFFKTLDSLIAAAEKHTKYLHTLKGSYLQRMLV